jgi:hypothetical protein
MEALIKDPMGVIHRVHANEYMGQNYGRITAISGDKVDLVELVSNGNGGWMERPASIALAARNRNTGADAMTNPIKPVRSRAMHLASRCLTTVMVLGAATWVSAAAATTLQDITYKTLPGGKRGASPEFRQQSGARTPRIHDG